MVNLCSVFTCIHKPMLKKKPQSTIFYYQKMAFCILVCSKEYQVTVKCVMERKTNKYVSKLKEADLIPFLTQPTFGA